MYPGHHCLLMPCWYWLILANISYVNKSAHWSICCNCFCVCLCPDQQVEMQIHQPLLFLQHCHSVSNLEVLLLFFFCSVIAASCWNKIAIADGIKTENKHSLFKQLYEHNFWQWSSSWQIGHVLGFICSIK